MKTIKIVTLLLYITITGSILATPPCMSHPDPNNEQWQNQMDWIVTGRITDIAHNIKIYVNCGASDRSECNTYDNAQFILAVDEWKKPTKSQKTIKLEATGWCTLEFPGNPNGIFTFYGMNIDNSQSPYIAYAFYVQHTTDELGSLNEKTEVDEIQDIKIRNFLFNFLIVLFMLTLYFIYKKITRKEPK